MACSLIPILAHDDCSFVEREKHRIDIYFEGVVQSIIKDTACSKVIFGPHLTFTIYSEMRHIFKVGKRYRVSIWNDGSADFELLENEI
jgi:hypothetical protein